MDPKNLEAPVTQPNDQRQRDLETQAKGITPPNERNDQASAGTTRGTQEDYEQILGRPDTHGALKRFAAADTAMRHPPTDEKGDIIPPKGREEQQTDPQAA